MYAAGGCHAVLLIYIRSEGNSKESSEASTEDTCKAHPRTHTHTHGAGVAAQGCHRLLQHHHAASTCELPQSFMNVRTNDQTPHLIRRREWIRYTVGDRISHMHVRELLENC
jgi:hypothetical protein